MPELEDPLELNRQHVLQQQHRQFIRQETHQHNRNTMAHPESIADTVRQIPAFTTS